MTDLSGGAPIAPDAAEEPPLSAAELRQLRRLLRIARVEPDGATLRLRVGRARVTLRADGAVRIEGRTVHGVADEGIVLDGATIDLN